MKVGVLVREMTTFVRETFPKNISVKAAPTNDLNLIEADATQVHQILMNLCLNARDAMPEGGVLGVEAANFEVDENYASMTPEAQVGRYVVFRVSDTGTGISREILDRIFYPFFTTKAIGQGSDLGLSTVAGMVRGHRGFINVSSRVGKGSTFEIFLPALQTAGGGAAKPCLPPVPEMPRGHGELVLIVDDEEAIREVIAAILRESGYQTIAAADGAEALRLYAEQGAAIKAVLTDILMPGLDGAGLCRELRKMNPQVRIVASTGEAEESYFAELRSRGVKNFLTKPYHTEQLLVALHEALAASDTATPA